MSDETGKTPEWMAQLPDSLKGDEYLSQFQKMGEAMNTLLETKSQYEQIKNEYEPLKEEFESLKSNSFKAPESEEELHGVLKKFVPEDYGVEVEEDDTFMKGLLETAKNANYTKGQVQALNEFMSKYKEQQKASNDEAREKALLESQQQLEQRWGAKYGENVELANRGLKTFVNQNVLSEEGTKEMTRMINETEFGTSPAVMELFSVIGRLAQEDFKIEGDVSKQASSAATLEYPSMKNYN